MLGYWSTNAEYQSFVLSSLNELAITCPEALLEYKDAISKMLIFNTDPLKDIITSLYSSTGRPAEHQPEIFRSFVLMNHLQIPLNNWIEKLENNPVLRTTAGFTKNNLPKLSSYYDFINRIYHMDDRPIEKELKSKPRKKLKKGEKLKPKHPGITNTLVDTIIDKEETFFKKLNRRQERYLQKVFAELAVAPSVELGLVSDNISASGDGTCVETGASHYGVKICKCKEEGIFKCTCKRRFTDPNATWGWDSHNEHWFYGYNCYFISTYNKSEKVDLPLYFKFVEARRHDSVSAIFALSEFKELYPNLNIETFISDSASDNYASYRLLEHWDINAVIALNTKNEGNFTYPTALHINDHGVPICPGGNKMVYYGFDKGRSRLKWRCPRILGKSNPCEACSQCSPSDYGRVIYTKPSWDLRLFTKIPRGSDDWKNQMKQRTAAERVNNRILNHYGIEKSKTRGKKRKSFFVAIAAINVHLDAQLKFRIANKSFNFYELFDIPEAA